MKPKSIAFVTTYGSYEDAETHWNKLKNKEAYGIGVAGDEHFIIKVTAIDVILEENQQEPVAWIAYDEFGDFMLEATKEGDYPWQPLYTAPQTKPLSDKEIIDTFIKDGIYDCINDPYMQSDGKYSLDGDLIRFARAIEERHGIK